MIFNSDGLSSVIKVLRLKE